MSPQVALSKLPVGSDALTLPPPLESDMQKAANKTLPIIKKINEKDMKWKKEELKQIYWLRCSDPNKVHVVCDGMFSSLVNLVI